MNSFNRILFVEDEEHLRSVICLNLELEGYKVEIAETGEEAIQKYSKNSFDLIILDVMLPEIDGYAVCEHIRLKDKDTPIMFLSARSSTEERKKGLKLGADDYLPKPFDLEELLLRVKRLIQRGKGKMDADVQDMYEIGKAELNFKTFVIKEIATDKERELSQREMMFLKLLIARNGEAVSRNEILDIVWGGSETPSTRTIDNFIVQFRKDFEEDPKTPKHFKSIHGVGYRLDLAT